MCEGVILCIDNNYFELIIETDEDRHIIFKDKYIKKYNGKFFK